MCDGTRTEAFRARIPLAEDKRVRVAREKRERNLDQKVLLQVLFQEDCEVSGPSGKNMVSLRSKQSCSALRQHVCSN